MSLEIQQKKLIPSLILSLVLHLVVLKGLELLPQDFFSFKVSSFPEKNKPLQIRNIIREDQKKYRTVGIKNGEKTFSMPVKDGQAGEEKQTKTPKIIAKKAPPKKVTKKKPVKKTEKKEKKISLNSLRVKATDGSIPAKNSKMQTLEEEKSDSKLKITTNSPVNYQRTKEAQTDVLKDLASSPDNARVLRKSGFNMQLQPPEGISEDELNSMEKIFYSFQKRTFRTYVTSFLSNYREILLSRPAIKKTLQEDRHNLGARVIFDREGNIVSIKILRSTPNDDVHDLFENTLKDIRKLPNPPKDLLSQKGNFTIYYQLKIN